MAKILTFRNKESAALDQVFLTDENEKLSFRTAADGAVSLGTVSSVALPTLPDPKKDWGNQELADLFRVRQLLSGANVPVETLRGITDEGDPWFVFCHMNGDVFIHMARIDGLYVLDSPNVQRPLRGRDFNELIADFTNDALPTYGTTEDSDGTERSVIRLERGGKVQLHPSAMLAALIWTLFLASEDLVLLAPQEQNASNDDLLDFADVIAADFDFQTLAMETANVAGFGTSPETTKELHEETQHNAPEAQVQMRDAIGQQGLATHQNGFAMGLSTIAIAMGFMSEAVLLDNQRKVLEGLKSIGFTQYAAEDGPELDLIAGEGGDALLAMLGEFLGLDIGQDTEVTDAATGKAEGSLLQQDMLHVTAGAVDEIAPLTVPKTVQAVVREDGDIELSEAHSDLSDKNVIDMETLVAMATAGQDTPTITMSDLLGGTDQMEEFQLGQTTVMASFDVTETDAFSLADYLSYGERTTNHSEFDDRAQAFINFIQDKDTDIGIVTIGNETIMIDRGAYTYAGDAAAYYYSWEDNYGQVISVIGLKSEFQEFGLIA